MAKALLVGATGTVGRAVAQILCARGWSVAACARTSAALDELRVTLSSDRLTLVPGSLASEDSTRALASEVEVETLDAVIVTTAAVWQPRPIAEIDFDTIQKVFDGDLRLHVNAARTLIPRLAPGAVYLATGGGMADFTFPGMGPASMTQAAQRALLRSWHKESADTNVHIRELLIASMVRGHGTDEARDGSLTAMEIAERLVDIVEHPLDNPGPVVTVDPSLRST